MERRSAARMRRERRRRPGSPRRGRPICALPRLPHPAAAAPHGRKEGSRTAVDLRRHGKEERCEGEEGAPSAAGLAPPWPPPSCRGTTKGRGSDMWQDGMRMTAKKESGEGDDA
ncbi:unnamed protein product [Urochloa humidicola]